MSLLLIADGDIGKAGPVGLFLILSLLIAVFLLVRSMRTHLRRVPLEFPDPTKPTGPSRGSPVLENDVREDEVLEGEILDRPVDRTLDRNLDRKRVDGDGADRPGTSGPESI